ncbi:MAG: BA14K family protein [Rhizobiaceae bacterium]|nr:BA14K family protein [Rhizobiaceae bacterium]
MKKLWSALCGSALAASIAFSSAIPVGAAPLNLANSAPAGLTRSDVQNVDDRRIIRRYDRRIDRIDRRFDRRMDRREWRRDAWRHDDRRGWYNGHRGYPYYRPGYRRYGDFWYPAAAFIAGAVIAGALADDNPPNVVYRGNNAHIRWCYDRYRSYRASDNTFQPYNGPRRQCYSPYD